MNERIQILKEKTKGFLLNFNLFPSTPPSTDQHQLRNQLISTRVFIILLALSLSILILYTSLINVTQTINLKTPTLIQYSQLYSTYPQTLTCPCTKISINYKTFLQLQYTLHQVCSSIFVGQYWINYLIESRGTGNMFASDFRSSGTYAFQALSTFCELVNDTISNRLLQFYSNQYVSASVVSSEVFKSEVEALISQFILSTTNDFLILLTTIRDTTQSNALVSGQLSNYGFLIHKSDTYLGSFAYKYGDCSCSILSTCSAQYPIYDYPNSTILFSVPGMYFGCYLVESLLQSNLQCFYDQTCITRLQSYSLSPLQMNVTTLNISLSNRFFENSTIEELVNKLMVEEWNLSMMYENYYNECQPKECSYSYKTKNSIIYIITTIVGLIGGLVTVLKLIVPRLVKFIAFCIQKWRRRRRVVAVMPIVQT